MLGPGALPVMTPDSRPSPGPCGQPISDHHCQPAGVHHHYKPTEEPHSEPRVLSYSIPTVSNPNQLYIHTPKSRCQALPVISHTTKAYLPIPAIRHTIEVTHHQLHNTYLLQSAIMPSSASVYDNENYHDATPPQLAFPASYEYDSDPVAAMTSYSKVMHQHTKRQMEAATTSGRRRTSSSDPIPSLPGSEAVNKQSSISSLDSITSRSSM